MSARAPSDTGSFWMIMSMLTLASASALVTRPATPGVSGTPVSVIRASPVVGAATLRKEALNCTPWTRSLIQAPLAWTNSPAEIIAACPSTVISSRWPRALMRNTQKPLSSLWNVTRSTRPARTSVAALGVAR